MARPREFDEASALDAAMDCFWREGYEATSVRDLAARMGITGASLYNCRQSRRSAPFLARSSNAPSTAIGAAASWSALRSKLRHTTLSAGQRWPCTWARSKPFSAALQPRRRKRATSRPTRPGRSCPIAARRHAGVRVLALAARAAGGSGAACSGPAELVQKINVQPTVSDESRNVLFGQTAITAAH
jgi:hypothetical protein